MGLQRAGHDLVTEQQQNIHPTGQAQFPMPTASAVHAPDITAQQQHYELWDFPGGSADKEFTCNAGDPSSISGLGKSTGEGIVWLLNPVFLGFPGGSDSKESAYNTDTCVQSLGWEGPLEKG